MDGLRCIFQDEHIYAIHKPEGVPFHNTAVEHALQEGDYQEGIVMMSKRLLNDEQIFPVHRLDRMTSGLMIFARHAQANRELSKALAEKRVEKYYLGLSRQKPKKKQGSVIGDMHKSRSGSYKLLRSHQHPAITRFFARSISLNDGTPAWLFALKPETGKTHQLRVAMKSLGSAILGDQRYADASASRGYLHAYLMKFELFGQRYALCDPEFSGAEFSLPQWALTKDMTPNAMDFLSPDSLPWAKSAFTLPAVD